MVPQYERCPKARSRWAVEPFRPPTCANGGQAPRFSIHRARNAHSFARVHGNKADAVEVFMWVDADDERNLSGAELRGLLPLRRRTDTKKRLNY